MSAPAAFSRKGMAGPVELHAASAMTGDLAGFTATLARFDQGPDKEGDVYAPGAFPTGKSIVISAYQHTSWQGALPVGFGTVHENAVGAYVKGLFFTNTTLGKDTYLTVRQLAEKGLGEWSYGFDTLDYSTDRKDLEPFGPGAVRLLKKLDVFEASPVLVGAGRGTGTTEIASADVEELRDQLVNQNLERIFLQTMKRNRDFRNEWFAREAENSSDPIVRRGARALRAAEEALRRTA